EVRQRYPQMVRLILSGHSDYEMILRAVGQSHQYLAKPCNIETLLTTIARTCALRELLAHEDLRRLVTAMPMLPSPPPLYAEVIEIAQSPDGSLDQIGEIIQRDIGKVILAVNLPELYQQTLVLAQTKAIAAWEAERALLNTTHAEVGAYLLGLWGLPDGIVEALAYHHNQRLCPHNAFTPLTAVHVANALIHEMDVVDGGSRTEPIDLDYLVQIGLDDRLAVWRERCRIAYQQ